MAVAARKWSDAGIADAASITPQSYHLIVQGSGSYRAYASQFKDFVLAEAGVTLSAIANVPSGTVFYRKSAGNGPPETQDIPTLKADLGLSGTNSGDQTLTFTGAATGSGSSTVPLTLADGVVTLAKMAPVSSGTFLYRKTAASGAPETQTLATVKADLGLQGVNSGDQIIGTIADSTAATLADLKTDFNALLAALRAPSAGAPLLTTGGTPVIAFSTASVTQTEGASGATAFLYTVTRGSGSVAGTSSASWAVTGTGGNPANASDFQGGVLPSGTVTFGPGVTSQVITVNVAGDAVVETDEGFTVTLSAPSGATLGTATATGTITNDDTVPVITMTTSSLTQAEGASGATNFDYTVTRSGNLAGASSVNWAVTGSGSNPAVAADFVGAALPSGTLNWATGETVKTLTVPVAGDSTVESDEAFTVTLSGVSGATLDATTATGTITNDDSAGTGRSAPTLGYPTPLTTNPATISVTLPSDWVTGDVLKLDRSASSSMSSPTTLSHTLTDADAAAGTFSIGLAAVTLSGNTYFQAYEGSSANKSNVTAWGDNTAPSITTTAAQTNIETQPLSVTLTASDAGVGVPNLLSDGTSPGYYISGGNDQLQYELAIVGGNVVARWYGNGTQTVAAPADYGVNSVYDVQIIAVDRAGNKSSPFSLATTVQAGDFDPNHQTFATVSGAARSTTVPAAETWTVSGVEPGLPATVTVSGGLQWSKNGGAFTSAAGSAVNTDTINVQLPTSSSYETTTTGSITVGTYTTTFSTTTIADPANIPWTAGAAIVGTSSGANVNYGSINFTQTGLFICVVRCTNAVRTTGMTVGGTASGAAIDETATTNVGSHTAMFAVPILSTGSKAVQAQTGSFPSGGTLLWGMLVPTSNTPTSSNHRGNTFTADPHTLGATLTVPAAGILIAGGVVDATPTWNSPMNGSLYHAGSGLTLGVGRTTCNPSFSTGSTFFNMVAATWG